MHQLNIIDKSRIFCLYYGQDYQYKSTRAGVTKTFKEQITLSDRVTEKLLHDKDHNCKILLRDLQTITEKELHEICKVVAENEFGDFRYSKWQMLRSERWDDVEKLVTLHNPKASSFFQFDFLDGEVIVYEGQPGQSGSEIWAWNTYPQWYFQNGFVVPILPWRKNAVDLGIAIYKDVPVTLPFATMPISEETFKRRAQRNSL